MASAADYETFFKAADTDGSGHLTKPELFTMMKKRGFRGSESQMEGYFASCDPSGDGKVSLNEFLQAMGAIPSEAKADAAMMGVFRAFDKDGSGFLDNSELKAAIQEVRSKGIVTEAEIDRLIKKIDSDGDSKVNYEELMDYFRS